MSSWARRPRSPTFPLDSASRRAFSRRHCWTSSSARCSPSWQEASVRGWRVTSTCRAASEGCTTSSEGDTRRGRAVLEVHRHRHALPVRQGPGGGEREARLVLYHPESLPPGQLHARQLRVEEEAGGAPRADAHLMRPASRVHRQLELTRVRPHTWAMGLPHRDQRGRRAARVVGARRRTGRTRGGDLPRGTRPEEWGSTTPPSRSCRGCARYPPPAWFRGALLETVHHPHLRDRRHQHLARLAAGLQRQPDGSSSMSSSSRHTVYVSPVGVRASVKRPYTRPSPK